MDNFKPNWYSVRDGDSIYSTYVETLEELLRLSQNPLWTGLKVQE